MRKYNRIRKWAKESTDLWKLLGDENLRWTNLDTYNKMHVTHLKQHLFIYVAQHMIAAHSLPVEDGKAPTTFSGVEVKVN